MVPTYPVGNVSTFAVPTQTSPPAIAVANAVGLTVTGTARVVALQAPLDNKTLNHVVRVKFVAV